MTSVPSTQSTATSVVQPVRSTQGGDVAQELAGFLTGLIELQCALCGALVGVITLAGSDKRRAGLFARYVRPGREDLLTPALLARLERVGAELAGLLPDQARQGRSESITLPRAGDLYGSETTYRLIASPLGAAGTVEGASVLVLPGSADGPGALQLVGLAGSKFEAFLWRQHAMQESRQKVLARETLELLDASQKGPSAKAMGALMCDELRRRFGCTRVSIGLVQGPAQRMRLAAVSGADEADRRGPAVEAIEAAMEECALQDVELLYPAPADAERDPELRRVLRSHQALSQSFGPSAVLSLPLRVAGDLVGVVVLERDLSDPFPAGSVPLVRLAAEFIGPALWTRRLADRGMLAVARDRVRDAGAWVVGPTHTWIKLIGVISIVALVLAAVVPVPRRVTADAECKAATSRTIVAPYVGYLREVMVKPGVPVREGDVLARMDTTDLELQAANLEARRATIALQRDAASAGGKQDEAAMAESSLRELDAQLTLLRSNIAKATLRSPISGVVSRGDLEEFIGARVEPSQALMEVVRDDRVVIVQVDERDIGRVHEGQRGRLASRARPDQKVEIEVRRVNPVAEPVRGANVYLVEAAIVTSPVPEWLRAGETGIARLEAGRTTVLGALARPIVEQARLRLWW